MAPKKPKTKSYKDNAKPVISPKVLEKIIADSKKKAKLETQKKNSPKTNWVTKIGQQ